MGRLAFPGSVAYPSWSNAGIEMSPAEPGNFLLHDQKEHFSET